MRDTGGKPHSLETYDSRPAVLSTLVQHFLQKTFIYFRHSLIHRMFLSISKASYLLYLFLLADWRNCGTCAAGGDRVIECLMLANFTIEDKPL